MTHVQLERIDQTFGQKHVLSGLDLSIESGEYVVLLGPSGCGKTTTLRIIAGLISPDRGDVLFDRRRVNDVPPRHRDVAMVFQQDGLYPHLTVGESIRFALRGKIGRSEMKARVENAVRLTKTESILDRYPSGLSGGELRRAAVAKAIARGSSIRLLDEPLSALDAPVRHALQDDILRWHAAVPGTSIHVTHDGQEAMRMADRIAVMDQGRIVQFATPAEIYRRPQCVAAATAIGSPPINLLPAQRDGQIVEVRNPSVSCRLNLDTQASELLIGVRPDSFQLLTDRPGEDTTAACLEVTGELLRRQFVGRDSHLHIDAGGQTLLAVVPAELGQDVPVESIRLAASFDSIHLFDAASGQRIETVP